MLPQGFLPKTFQFYFIPTLQMRKQKLRDLTWLSQGPTVNRQGSWHWNSGVCDAEGMPGPGGASGPARLEHIADVGSNGDVAEKVG